MRALVYHGPGQKAWEEAPEPEITDDGDVIVRVDAVTICGTDLHILKGDVPAVAQGRILGHEAVGPLDFYVPAYIGLVWASVGLLALPVHLAWYREDGVLRRLRASAAPKWAVFGSQAIVASAIALAGGVLVIAAAALAYHIHAPRAPAGVLAAWLLAGSVFACLGILLSCIPTSRGALGAGLGLFFVMMMLSGAEPPVRGDDRRHAARQRHPPAHLRDPDPAGPLAGHRDGLAGRSRGPRNRGRGSSHRAGRVPLGITGRARTTAGSAASAGRHGQAAHAVPWPAYCRTSAPTRRRRAIVNWFHDELVRTPRPRRSRPAQR